MPWRAVFPGFLPVAWLQRQVPLQKNLPHRPISFGLCLLHNGSRMCQAGQLPGSMEMQGVGDQWGRERDGGLMPTIMHREVCGLGG